MCAKLSSRKLTPIRNSSTMATVMQASRNCQVSMSGWQGIDGVGAARRTVRSLTENCSSLTHDRWVPVAVFTRGGAAESGSRWLATECGLLTAGVWDDDGSAIGQRIVRCM